MSEFLTDTTPLILAEGGAGLWESIVNLFVALSGIVIALLELALPFLPLAGWIAFWLFAVNWVKLRQVMIEGGWIGVVLIGLIAVLVWGTVSPPEDGYHYMLGLSVTNYFGKLIYVTILICIMFLCGMVQLGGMLPACCQFEEAEEHVGDSH